jgi:replication factor C small subunit
VVFGLTTSPSAGIGKSTVAKAIVNQIGCEFIVINGSSDMGMETLRVKITNFVTAISLSGKRRCVIVDEADGMPPKTQEALRSFIEEHSQNCGWIFTCNFANKIIAPIHSRCSVIDFRLEKEDRPKMAAKFMARVKEILNQEEITFDTKVVAQVVMNYFPDFRRTLNELQRFSVNGSIDEGILAKQVDTDVKELVVAIKAKNFKDVRQWCENNADADMPLVYQKLYDTLLDSVNEVPQVVLMVADYSYKDYFVVNKVINLTACCVEIMASCSFK